MAQTGIDFHRWRCEYANYLSRNDKWRDPAWTFEWLEHNAVSADARDRILVSSANWTINPKHIYASELFLSVDAEFQPLEIETDRKPGSVSDRAEALCSGTIDLLLLDEAEATIIDAKSGFSAQSITEDEAAIYCCLVFAHFPRIEVITFWWDFVRLGVHKRSEYARDELADLQKLVRRLAERRHEIEEKPFDQLSANSTAGNCYYCQLNCPLMAEPLVQQVGLAGAPLQTPHAAAALARAIMVCEIFLGAARPRLREFIANREDLPGGRLAIGGDYVAENRTSVSQDLPLPDTLFAMGVGLFPLAPLKERNPDVYERAMAAMRDMATPDFDVPLSSLRVSSSSMKYFSTPKKGKSEPPRSRKIAGGGGGVSRAGLREALSQISKPTAKSVMVVIRKETETAEDEARQIEGGVE